MSEYYVWNTEAEAQAALDYINGTNWFPITGRNARTGQLEPDKQKTTAWASEVNERVDGKWCFPRISAEILDSLNVSQEDRELFLTTFNPSIETYQNGWFPPPEELV